MYMCGDDVPLSPFGIASLGFGQLTGQLRWTRPGSLLPTVLVHFRLV